MELYSTLYRISSVTGWQSWLVTSFTILKNLGIIDLYLYFIYSNSNANVVLFDAVISICFFNAPSKIDSNTV